MAMVAETKTIGNALVYDQVAFSREKKTVLAGSGAARALTAGMVVAEVSKGAASAVAGGSNTGNGAMGAITVKAAAVPGVYTLRIVEAATNAGRFILLDPDGDVVGEGNVAVAFDQGGLAFTLADGATDFAVGDTFAITVAAGSGKVVQVDAAGLLGSEDALGILYEDVTAPDGVDADGLVVVRHAVVRSAGLVWPAGATAGQKAAWTAQLAARDIHVR